MRRSALPLGVIVVLLATAWWLHQSRREPNEIAPPPDARDARIVETPKAPGAKSISGLQFSSAGYGAAPLGSECAPEDETYDFAFEGRLLVAKICEAEESREIVRHTYWGQVTAGESDAIVEAASKVTRAEDTPCTGDRPFRWAWIMKDGGAGAGETTRFTFTDHVWRCSESSAPFAKELDPLLVALRSARKSLTAEAAKKTDVDDAGTGPVVHPAAGVTISVSGANDTPIGSTCMRGSTTYTLAPESAKDKALSWETCEPSERFDRVPLRLHWHERVLTQPEYERVFAQIRRVERSTKTTCERSRATIALTAATSAKADLFVDDAHACRHTTERHAVTGLDPLVDVLRALAKDATSDHVQDENE